MDLMTVNDVEEYLGGKVSAATLRWWKHENKGRGPKSFKLGRRLVYKKADVDEWIDAQYNAANQTA